MSFSAKTFQYFDAAKRNRKNKAWLERNMELYEQAVRIPLADVIVKLQHELGKDLPRVVISPKKISRPLFRANRIPDDGSVIKTCATVFFSEKPTSRFEWNPGIYISIGARDEDNILGVGLYMPSSRQNSLLRDRIAHDFASVDKIFSARNLKKRWGPLAGEKYKRFPKGFDVNSPAAEYLWYKQFFFSQHLSRKEITAKNFPEKVVLDYKVALPFLKWLRATVGVYRPG